MDTDESTAARGVPEAGARDQVLVGVDGSSNASCAALWAAAEAEKLGAQLLVAHAVQLPAHAEAAVKPFEAEFPKVNVHLEVREGNAVPEPVEAARDAELLVVGAHRRHGPLSIGAGYVVDGVLGRSTAPVAVIPESGGGTT